MKKITIFAFIGFVFVAGMFFVSKAQAAEAVPASGQQISAEEAKILKQTLDVLEIVLKDIESRVVKNELTLEKKVLVNESLSTIEGSLVRVDYIVKNYAGGNYPGMGSLYAESDETESGSTTSSGLAGETKEIPKGALASLWATVWPGKVVGAILLLAAAAVLIFGFKKKEQQTTT